ncbi:DNA glycosylase/AP lyase [Heracleum sosnowskyi]|uniref:DNA glycosylase/AP lyase n=1 Tax=Heracleum sosnowskyi TaxID=360622 RepID=A0AAD8M6J0_9APIA|nr:DNA glycosylase/AP lyase [Heracleum sosnowskyi]
MPELPEVEAARRAIEENCIGKKIIRALIADDSKVIDAVSPSDFQASLVGKTIAAAHRKGKNMWLQLDSPPFPTFQFGMAGAIYIKGVAVTKYKRSAVKDTDEWPSKYSKVFMELDDGLELSFTDKRRFAKVRLLENPISVLPISDLGPDALFEPMTADDFFKSLSSKKTGIKALLLDQSFISGIGNWIADEVLYQAKIHPLQTSASISKESCAALHQCIKEVIEKAVEVGADSSQFPSGWIFHSREKRPGKAIVDGKKIEFINAGGRTSAFVPELQKLTESQAAKAPVRSRKISKNDKEDVDDDDDDGDGPEEQVQEEDAKHVKLKGKNTAKQGRKPPAKRKNIENDSVGVTDEVRSRGKNPSTKVKPQGSEKNVADQVKKTRGGRKPPAKRKSNGSDDEHDDDHFDSDNDKEDQEIIEKKQSKAKNETGKRGKQPKKRAK